MPLSGRETCERRSRNVYHAFPRESAAESQSSKLRYEIASRVTIASVSPAQSRFRLKEDNRAEQRPITRDRDFQRFLENSRIHNTQHQSRKNDRWCFSIGISRSETERVERVTSRLQSCRDAERSLRVIASLHFGEHRDDPSPALHEEA